MIFREAVEKVLKSKDIEIKDFISGLSLAFRYTEKYATVLQEVERNTPVCSFQYSHSPNYSV